MDKTDKDKALEMFKYEVSEKVNSMSEISNNDIKEKYIFYFTDIKKNIDYEYNSIIKASRKGIVKPEDKITCLDSDKFNDNKYNFLINKDDIAYNIMMLFAYIFPKVGLVDINRWRELINTILGNVDRYLMITNTDIMMLKDKNIDRILNSISLNIKCAGKKICKLMWQAIIKELIDNGTSTDMLIRTYNLFYDYKDNSSFYALVSESTVELDNLLLNRQNLYKQLSISDEDRKTITGVSYILYMFYYIKYRKEKLSKVKIALLRIFETAFSDTDANIEQISIADPDDKIEILSEYIQNTSLDVEYTAKTLDYLIEDIEGNKELEIYIYMVAKWLNFKVNIPVVKEVTPSYVEKITEPVKNNVSIPVEEEITENVTENVPLKDVKEITETFENDLELLNVEENNEIINKKIYINVDANSCQYYTAYCNQFNMVDNCIAYGIIETGIDIEMNSFSDFENLFEKTNDYELEKYRYMAKMGLSEYQVRKTKLGELVHYYPFLGKKEGKYNIISGKFKKFFQDNGITNLAKDRNEILNGQIASYSNLHLFRSFIYLLKEYMQLENKDFMTDQCTKTSFTEAIEHIIKNGVFQYNSSDIILKSLLLPNDNNIIYLTMTDEDYIQILEKEDKYKVSNISELFKIFEAIENCGVLDYISDVLSKYNLNNIERSNNCHSELEVCFNILKVWCIMKIKLELIIVFKEGSINLDTNLDKDFEYDSYDQYEPYLKEYQLDYDKIKRVCKDVEIDEVNKVVNIIYEDKEPNIIGKKILNECIDYIIENEVNLNNQTNLLKQIKYAIECKAHKIHSDLKSNEGWNKEYEKLLSDETKYLNVLNRIVKYEDENTIIR